MINLHSFQKSQSVVLSLLSYQPPAGGPGAPMMQPMMGQPMMGQPLMRPPFTGVAGAAPGAAAPGAPVTNHTHSRACNQHESNLCTNIANLYVIHIKRINGILKHNVRVQYVCPPFHVWSTYGLLCFLLSQLSPGPASQSPKKPKDPLADLDLKDFL